MVQNFIELKGHNGASHDENKPFNNIVNEKAEAGMYRHWLGSSLLRAWVHQLAPHFQGEWRRPRPLLLLAQLPAWHLLVLLCIIHLGCLCRCWLFDFLLLGLLQCPVCTS